MASLELEDFSISPLVPDAASSSLAAAAKDPTTQWLIDLLADGPLLVSEVKARAHAHGLQWWPLKEKRRGLPIISEELYVDGVKKWRWRLRRW